MKLQLCWEEKVLNKVVFGVVVTSRSCFPDHLAVEARKMILKKLDSMGFSSVIVSERDTPLGVVQTYSDAVKCADLFQKNRNRIDGVIAVLPNFGEETGVSAAIDQAQLQVPVLVQACEDSLEKLQIENRRDAFCGKLSLCNNLYQRGIRFTNTTTHTCSIDSDVFTKDLEFFAAVCRVVKGLSHARIGAIGSRPDPFHTVRYSEKLLQAYGITVSAVDLAEIIFKSREMGMTPEVSQKAEAIKNYGKIAPQYGEEDIIRQAKLCMVIEDWVRENQCDATAIQCWNALEQYYGCAPCLAMSLMGERGLPSACELDVLGALTMYAMNLASGEPSGYLDWNNNYAEDRDKCICLHCSNFPKRFAKAEMEISDLDVLGTTLGAENCFGACKTRVAAGPMTFAKITTDDRNGKIKAYVGEGEFTDDPAETKGGVAVCHVRGLQNMMKYITKNGFEHHVAMNRSSTADVLEEAFGNYLGWEVYRHR